MILPRTARMFHKSLNIIFRPNLTNRFDESKRFCQSVSSAFDAKSRNNVTTWKKKFRLGHHSVLSYNGDGVCAAYCLNNPVRLGNVSDYFRGSSFKIRKQKTEIDFKSIDLNLFAKDVIHVVLRGYENKTVHHGHAFFFSSGAIVLWGLPLELREQLIGTFSKFEDATNTKKIFVKQSQPSLNLALPMEDFDHEFRFIVDPKRSNPTFRNDEIQLVNFEDPEQLLALSYGLAQSVKLMIYEDEIDSLVSRTRRLPDELAREGKIRLSHRELKGLIGELLAARYSVNLVSDIMDTPEFFWQHAELESLHLECAREVELRQRARILDTRTEVIRDALDILNNELSSSSSIRVERAILFFIAVEVLIEISRTVPIANLMN